MKVSNEDLKVNFYLKKKVLRDGLCPVMVRIRIGRDMVQFSCKLDADPNLWDVRAGRVNGKSHHARNVNSEIDKINVALNAKYKEIISMKGSVMATELKNACQGISSAQETLLYIFRQHNEEYKKRAGINNSIKTWLSYNNSLNHLERFINMKYNVSDMLFRQLDYSFIENYDFYLRIDLKMKPRSVLHKISCLRKITKIAIDKGFISRDPFYNYSAERPKTIQRYIPIDEVEKLIRSPQMSYSQEFTRDMFVFSCFTGLAYIDLCNLKNGQIIKMDDGSLWLNIRRQKTDSISKIPLLDVPLEILEKYNGTVTGDKIFPMKSPVSMNLQLKKVAKHCGIDRHLTFHMSRHTFATEICLSQDVPIETVNQMLGHSKLSTTQIYAKITQNKVEQDMEELSEIIKDKYVFTY